MDLRGKILRITVQDDGGYSIPEGNLFPQGTAQTRPEIYIMGCRNPFRFTLDSASGDLIWADLGPDARKADPERGPRGMGEFNRATEAGFWGWPYSVGNNQPYVDYDFARSQSGAPFDPQRPRNDSPNSNGLVQLPPSRGAFVWYSYGVQPEFPWPGAGGVNPMVGPVFYRENFAESVNTFPAYFEGGLFLYEWARDWIAVGHFDRTGARLRRVEPFLPDHQFSHPMDMLFASDGNLYVLEYGRKWKQRNPDASLNRISYHAQGTDADNEALIGKPELEAGLPEGQRLVHTSGCLGCHDEQALVNGPSFRQVAARYSARDSDYLAGKILEGGAGVWGDTHMPPHPQLTSSEINAVVDWILSLGEAGRQGEQGHQR
tara:strand:+ start:668 stop:1792 length:1125 start_codon:yes stop_codon:yes gene_type:complete